LAEAFVNIQTLMDRKAPAAAAMPMPTGDIDTGAVMALI